jgi:peptidoglycan/LPS O-acetylase OafA/YrhL
MGKDNQLVSIQYLRGIAALGVVLCHYASFSYGQLGVDLLNIGFKSIKD